MLIVGLMLAGCGSTENHVRKHGVASTSGLALQDRGNRIAVDTICACPWRLNHGVASEGRDKRNRLCARSWRQSAMQLTTRSSSADHIALWFAFTMQPTTWSKRTSTRAISKSREFLLAPRRTSRYKEFSMIPLLSGDRERGKRIRPERPVIKGRIFPPSSR